jgi:antibiotic biosynthesis monooxygenase (ABM) superfamily enzyme
MLLALSPSAHAHGHHQVLHVATMRRAREGREAELEAMLERFIREAEGDPLSTGAYLLRPSSDADPREFGIVRSFRDEKDMRAFYDSPRFHRWDEEIRPLTEGEAIRKPLHGMEAFFPRGAPPRWKMALLTWIGVTPLVYAFGKLVPMLTGPLPEPVGLMIVTASVVATLAWVIMPFLTRTLAGWLHKR